MSMVRKGSVLVTLGALAALVAAVAALGGATKGTATTTDGVTAGKPSEFRFTLAKKTAVKGTVVFKITNKGSINHDFKIAGKKTAQVAPGKTATLRIVFKKAGKFPYMCTLPGHAAAGMKGTFTVK